MPDPGSFVINNNGQFFLQPDGSWAVFDSAGKCSPCCGGGQTDPWASCANSLSLVRNFICPLTGQPTTINARNSWSDNFNNYPQETALRFPWLAEAPCDNYVRFGLNATAYASSALTSASFGGPGNLWTQDSEYRIYLVNGYGQTLETTAAITARGRTPSSPLSGLSAPNNMALAVEYNIANVTGGTIQSAAISANSSFQWVISIGSNPQIIAGTAKKNDRISLHVTHTLSRLNSTQWQLLIAVDWQAGTFSGSGSSTRTVAWSNQTTPPGMCYTSHRAFATGAGVWDDYAGTVINPTYIAI